MTWKEKLDKTDIPAIFAIALAFFMPLMPKILPAILVLLFLSALIRYKKLYFHKEFKAMTWLFALTYLFYVFGLLNSNHVSEGLFILEVKLSFLLLPLFFLFHGSFHVVDLRRIYFAFIAGCFVNTFFSINQGYECYMEREMWECFFSSYMSYHFHTTYLAIYFCFSILILIYYIINYYSRLRYYKLAILVFLVIYFSGFVMMLSSKGGLIALFTVIFVSLMYFLYKRGKIRNAIIILTSAAAIMTVVVFTSDYAQVRFSESMKIFKLSKTELYRDYKESTETTAVRLMIWDVSQSIIYENPFGTGTGDAQSALMEKYKEAGMKGALDGKLNCHNQFYETALSIGIQGLTVLIIFLTYLLVTAIRKRNFLLLWIVVIIILNLFFESMFETQAGVIFFVFFTGLLLTSVPEVIPISPDESEMD